jgi:hypothetical protein
LKTILFFCIGAILISCVNTRFSYFTGKPYTSSSNRFLIGQINGLSSGTSYDLFEISEAVLASHPSSFYLPSVEYDLIRQGISKDSLYQSELSTPTKIKINELLGVSHLVKIQGSFTPSTLYTYETAMEQTNPAINRETNGNNAWLIFDLIPMTDKNAPISFKVETKISSLSIDNDEGDTNHVNMSANQGALYIAYRKAMKKIEKHTVGEK